MNLSPNIISIVGISVICAILFRKQNKPVSSHMPAPQSDWQKNGLEKLRTRLRALPDGDTLIPLLQQLIDEYGAIEIMAGLQANVSDGEAHRFRGRLGMALELRTALQELWDKSRAPKEQK